jgi:hypothetical protein
MLHAMRKRADHKALALFECARLLTFSERQRKNVPDSQLRLRLDCFLRSPGIFDHHHPKVPHFSGGTHILTMREFSLPVR